MVTCHNQSHCCLGNHQWPSSVQGKYGCNLHGTDRAVVAAIWLDQMAPVTESYSYRKNKVVSTDQGSVRHHISSQPIQTSYYTLITGSQIISFQVTKQKADCIRELWYVFFPCWINLENTFWGMNVRGKGFISGFISGGKVYYCQLLE